MLRDGEMVKDPHVILTAVESPGRFVDGVSFGTATLGIARSDVAAAYNNPNYLNTGYTFTGSAAGLSAGTHLVTAQATDALGYVTVSTRATITVVMAVNQLE